ncbi:MAG: proliferating cell nuclear antigen (pcna) [Candidatus Hodarchaeota archaeon]
MPFEAELTDIKDFRIIVEAISQMISDAVFVVSPSELSLRAMDASHAAMIDLEMQKDAFDSYECDTEYELNVNLENFKRVLGRVQKDDKTLFKFDETQNSLHIHFTGTAGRKFTLPLRTTMESSPLPAPDLPLEAEIDFEAGFLKEVVADMGIFSESVQVSTDENKVLFSTTSTDQHSVEIVVENKEGSVARAFNVGDPSSASYGLEYLRNIVRIDGIADSLKLELATAKPLRLTFTIGENITLRYLLAPYEEPEDDY